MAVIDDPATLALEARGGEGPVHIGQRCVVLEVTETSPHSQLLLAWRSAEVGWDGDTRTITFTAIGSEPIHLTDGDVIEVGGADVVSDDGGPEILPPVDWLVPPDPSCPTNAWGVHSVTVVDDR